MMSKEVSRRNFLKSTAIAGAAVMSAGALLGMPKQAWAQTPQYGGKLKFAIADSPLSFDPAYNASQYTARWLGFLLFDTLTFQTADMKIVPNLATSWKVVDKGGAWVFDLRKGVTFHNNRELTAKDVADHFNRVMDPKSGSHVAAALFPLKNAEIMDQYTVKLNLTSAYADFPVTVAKPDAAIIALESAGRETKNPLGTGPFKLKEFVPGEKVLFEKNPKYWKKGLPYLDSIEWLNIPDPATQVSALLSGQIDSFPELSKDYFEVLKKNNKIVVEEIPTGAHQPVVMQMSKKPFNDPRVVKAIKYCLDREKFVELVLNGHGVAANDVAVPPTDPFYHGIPLRKQDYALAKKLLAEAGYPNGLDLELITSEVRVNMVPTALTLKDMCAPAGIRINVKMAPPDTFWTEVWRVKPFFVGNWVGRPTIHDTLYPFFHKNSFDWNNPGGAKDKFNDCHLYNPTLSDLLDMGMSEMNDEKRRGIYKMSQAVIMEEGGYITPYVANYIMARRANVHGLVPHPLKISDFSTVWKSA
ncbi:MAG: ABC transporter substrate-binding protein [Thermodesulfobacteriota bacterium]